MSEIDIAAQLPEEVELTTSASQAVTGPADTSALTQNDIIRIFKRFSIYVKPVLGTFLAGSFFALLHGAISGVQPYFIKILMDDVLKKADITPLKGLLLLILLSAVLKSIFMYGQGYLLSFAGQSAVMKLRDEVYSHLQKLQITFFEKWQAGQIMYRVITDINLMTDSFTNGIMMLFADATVFIFAIAMMIFLDWRMTLIAFIATPVIAFIMNFFGSRIQKQVSKMQNRISDLNSLMQENISGIKVIKAFSAEDYERERFSKINEQAFGAIMKSLQYKLTQTPIVELIGTIGVLVIIGVGSYLVSANYFTAGDLIAFIAYALIASTPLNRISNTYADIRKGVVSAARVFELLDATCTEDDKPDAVELESVKGRIEFENVKFAYNEDRPVLRGVTFAAEPGKTIAVVGPNGAGKTTLTNLIPRFYEITGGSIKIDGRDIRDIKLSSLRSHIGIVLQDTILFSGTIKENICYGNPDIPDNMIIEAAKISNAHDFIMEFPEGYNTNIAEGGTGLSGGQRQRIAIARTILRNPEILILDEATSALDQKSEILVQNAIENLMKGRTTFVIAHRLSTIKKADEIIVLDHGTLSERGSHDELIAKNGLYKKLYEARELEAKE